MSAELTSVTRVKGKLRTIGTPSAHQTRHFVLLHVNEECYLIGVVLALPVIVLAVVVIVLGSIYRPSRRFTNTQIFALHFRLVFRKR